MFSCARVFYFFPLHSVFFASQLCDHGRQISGNVCECEEEQQRLAESMKDMQSKETALQAQVVM